MRKIGFTVATAAQLCCKLCFSGPFTNQWY